MRCVPQATGTARATEITEATESDRDSPSSVADALVSSALSVADSDGRSVFSVAASPALSVPPWLTAPCPLWPRSGAR